MSVRYCHRFEEINQKVVLLRDKKLFAQRSLKRRAVRFVTGAVGITFVGLIAAGLSEAKTAPTRVAASKEAGLVVPHDLIIEGWNDVAAYNVNDLVVGNGDIRHLRWTTGSINTTTSCADSEYRSFSTLPNRTSDWFCPRPGESHKHPVSGPMVSLATGERFTLPLGKILNEVVSVATTSAGLGAEAGYATEMIITINPAQRYEEAVMYFKPETLSEASIYGNTTGRSVRSLTLYDSDIDDRNWQEQYNIAYGKHETESATWQPVEG